MPRLVSVSKNYKDKVIFDNFSLTFEDKKITCILGESGAGKTTLANIILGLTDYSGSVEGIEKPISAVFQEDRLIPSLTVIQNINLVNKTADKTVLEEIGLAGTENLYPNRLSAGMARRVAILRGLLYPAKTLIMDEPFINLDIAIKFSIMEKIKKDQLTSPKTVIMITHDIKEAVTLADRIVLLKDSKIIYDNSNITADTENEIFNLMRNMRF